MSSETRQVIDQVLQIQQNLRDQQISLVGTSVIFEIPFTGNTTYDDFGDIVVTSTVKLYTEIIIKWGEYKASLAIGDMSTEQELPLLAFAKIADNIPKGSKVGLSYTDLSGKLIKRTFEVIGVELKVENIQTTKMLRMVPIRT